MRVRTVPKTRAVRSPCGHAEGTLLLCSVLSRPLRSHGLQPAGLLCPGDSPGENPGAGCHFLLQGIFPTQGTNPHLLHWQVNSSPRSHLESPKETQF